MRKNGGQAALMALDDAGLKIQDMQALYCGNLGQANAMVGQRLLQEIGQTGIGVVSCANACATGAKHQGEADIVPAIRTSLKNIPKAKTINKNRETETQ